MKTLLRYDDSPRVLTDCCFATGRSCIVHLIRKYSPSIVFLPQMTPEGLYDPFLHSGTTIESYRLLDNLEPDLEHLQDRMAAHPRLRPLVVVVHYFGYWMPTHIPAALAHQYGGLLLEDCAHCLPMEDRKSCADIALYSVNKFFAIEDGAMMLSCTDAADLSMPNNLTKLPQEAITAYREHMAANRIIGSMPAPETPLESEMLIEAVRQSRDAYERYYAFISADMEPHAHSKLKLREDIDAERERRHDNAVAIYHMAKGMRFRDDWPCFAFPIRCSNRFQKMEELQARGILATYLSDKWRCEPETDFWKTHLLLPLRERIESI